jgi:hypothetical protein
MKPIHPLTVPDLNEVKTVGMKKLMLPLVVSILRKEDGDHLQRVKKVLEE